MLTLLVTVVAIFTIVFKLYLKLTTGICKCSKHLVGKVVIVTGGNIGIGYETAKDFAERGARVILACRSEARGTEAREKIIAATGNNDIHYRNLDLASLTSVREFAKTVIKTEKRLDILVNNAGIFLADNVKTEDGLALMMQTNHFGPFLLTNLLLPLLKSSAPSRIVTVSSMGHTNAKLDFDNFILENETIKSYNNYQVYGTSKLCNILMTVELAERLKGTGVTTNCLHPGAIATDIMKIRNVWYDYATSLLKLFLKTAWEGAQTTIFLAVSPELVSVTGKYFSDCKEKIPTKLAQDRTLARKLWEASENIVGL